MIHFGPDIEAILRRLPAAASLFPYLQSVRSGDRATEFKQRCEGLGIKGISLHSYRYAWAERAKQCGYPERTLPLARVNPFRLIGVFPATREVVQWALEFEAARTLQPPLANQHLDFLRIQRTRGAANSRSDVPECLATKSSREHGLASSSASITRT
jgi:hypothetical protein